MSSGGQWLTGGRKRSYESDWSSYERRSNGQQRTTGVGGERYNSSNISASGSRAGAEYNSHQTGPQNRTNSYTSRAGAEYNSHQTGTQSRTNNYTSSNAASQGGIGGHNAPRNRVRVADYRGSAARVGNLPTRDPQAYAHQEPGNFRRGGPSSDANLQLFESASFLESLRNPPEITTKLPQNMRSTLNEEQCNVVESVLSGHSVRYVCSCVRRFCRDTNQTLNADILHRASGKRQEPRTQLFAEGQFPGRRKHERKPPFDSCYRYHGE